MEKVTVLLNRKLHKELKIQAAKEETSVTDLVDEAVERFLKSKKGGN